MLSDDVHNQVEVEFGSNTIKPKRGHGSNPSMKEFQQIMQEKESQFRKEFDDMQRERNKVVLSEVGARLQLAKDRIWLCYDDKDVGRLELGQLGKYQKEAVNEFRQQVLDERDKVVQEIEEMLNKEVLNNNKKLKREYELEQEFKSMNKK